MFISPLGAVMWEVVWGVIKDVWRLRAIRAEQRRDLEKLETQTLAQQHPEAAATVAAMKVLLDRQSRASFWQNVFLSTLFFILGVIATVVIGAFTGLH